MIQLLVAAAGCTGADIVVLLEKMRVRLTRFRLGVEGVRRDEEPRRYIALELTYELAGEGLDEVKARRAIDLSIEKYCSVLQSLAPDIPVRYHLALG
jgi:putative redox protein